MTSYSPKHKIWHCYFSFFAFVLINTQISLLSKQILVVFHWFTWLHSTWKTVTPTWDRGYDYLHSSNGRSHVGAAAFLWELHQLHENPFSAGFTPAGSCVLTLLPWGRGKPVNKLLRDSWGEMGVPGQVCRHGVWWAQESSSGSGELINAFSLCGWCALSCPAPRGWGFCLSISENSGTGFRSLL